MKTNLDFLFSEIYDRHSVRVIVFSRHGDKTPDNHITDECIKSIIENGMPGLDSRISVIQDGSACIRSTETALAAEKWIRNKGGAIVRHLPVDERLGSDQLFQDLFTPEIKEQMKTNGWKNYETLVNARIDGLMIFEQAVADAVNDMFKHMNAGDIALSVSHSPTVETAFNYFIDPDNRDNQMVIDSLDGIILVQVKTDAGLRIFAHR